MMPKTTVILHSDSQNNQLAEQFKLSVHSIVSQINRDFDVIFLGKTDAETRDRTIFCILIIEPIR
jgi:hypothetical protein